MYDWLYTMIIYCTLISFCTKFQRNLMTYENEKNIKTCCCIHTATVRNFCWYICIELYRQTNFSTSSVETCRNIVDTTQLLSSSDKLHAWTPCEINQLMRSRLCKLHALWICYMILDDINLFIKTIHVTYCFDLKHTIYIKVLFRILSFSKYLYQLH